MEVPPGSTSTLRIDRFINLQLRVLLRACNCQIPIYEAGFAHCLTSASVIGLIACSENF